MDEKRLNGFTIIAHEWAERHGDYVILGARRTGPGSYEYVTARMLNFDQDTTWYWGNYINNVADAVADFHNRITR